MTSLPPAFERLRSILAPYGRRMHVSSDGPTTYGVDMAPDAGRNPTTWFGGVRLGKRYVRELEMLTRAGFELTAGNAGWGAAKRVEHGTAYRRAGG